MRLNSPEFIPSILRVPRDEFVEERWHYRPGEHVTFIAPTGNGKTTLAMQLLKETATPDHPAVVLVMKPRDETSAKFGKQANFRTVRTWPPIPSIWKPRKPPGWMLWPRHILRDPKATNAIHEAIFQEAIMDCYARGNKIVFADELYSLENDLGLTDEIVCVHRKGRSQRCGLWGATQSPTYVSRTAYSQVQHLFLSYDPDKKARDRLREIGGVDPKLIERGMDTLDEFEWLYVNVKGRRSTICIVEA